MDSASRLLACLWQKSRDYETILTLMPAYTETEHSSAFRVFSPFEYTRYGVKNRI